MTFANVVTIFRLLLAPVIAYLFFIDGAITAGFILLALAGITDILDGYLARKRNEITELGKILDPVADKMVIAFCLLALSARYGLPWLISGFYLGKEGLQVLIGGLFYGCRGRVISANFFGKAATVGFYSGIALYIFPQARRFDWLWAGFFIVSIIMSAVAAFGYMRQMRKE